MPISHSLIQLFVSPLLLLFRFPQSFAANFLGKRPRSLGQNEGRLWTFDRLHLSSSASSPLPPLPPLLLLSLPFLSSSSSFSSFSSSSFLLLPPSSSSFFPPKTHGCWLTVLRLRRCVGRKWRRRGLGQASPAYGRDSRSPVLRLLLQVGETEREVWSHGGGGEGFAIRTAQS